MENLPNSEITNTFGNYRLGKTLGKGYQAKVKQGISKDGKVYAIKIFKTNFPKEKIERSLSREANHLRDLKHKNLVNLIEVIEDAQYVRRNGKSYKTVGIVLEYCRKGELFDYLFHSGRFQEPQARYYFRQLIDGLTYLHANNICHRDLKPENLLMDDNFTLKIADFGFSTKIDGNSGEGWLKSYLGTEGYMAPELNRKQVYLGSKVDIFAAGVILFIMMTGHPPFHNAVETDPYFKMLISNRNTIFWEAHARSKEKETFKQDFIQLIDSMLCFLPENRISMAEIISHPWYQSSEVALTSEIKIDFSLRHKKVQANFQKSSEKVKQQETGNKKDQENLECRKTGSQKFRNEVNTDREKIAQKYLIGKGNEKNSRIIEVYSIESAEDYFRETDLIVELPLTEVVTELLLQQRQFCEEVEFSDKEYKLRCSSIDSNEDVELLFSILLKIVDDESNRTIVLLRKKQGSLFQFHRICRKIHSLFNLPQNIELEIK